MTTTSGADGQGMETMTGATAEQIEATAEHYYTISECVGESFTPWECVGPHTQAVLKDWAVDILSAAVPPGFSIVRDALIQQLRERDQRGCGTHVVCPMCGGTREQDQGAEYYGQREFGLRCDFCNGEGYVPIDRAVAEDATGGGA